MTNSYAILSDYVEIRMAAGAKRITAYCEYRSPTTLLGDIAPVIRVAPDGIAEVINMRWNILPRAGETALVEPHIRVGDIMPCLIPVTSMEPVSSAKESDAGASHTNMLVFAPGHWCWMENDAPGQIRQGQFFYFDFAFGLSKQFLGSKVACERWLESGSPTASERMLYCDPLFNS